MAIEQERQHDILVWGPASEGERTASGQALAMPGWVWTCSCHSTGCGYVTEQEAEEFADRHLARAGSEGSS
jgi:hypothetical protein